MSVTRRLYWDGESGYLINRSPGRLKDVARFFIEAGMGTRNYSIIEQEKVGRLVDAPPEERRLLIDEAAGITRYKEQKRGSERRLESAGQNLVTVSTMLGDQKSPATGRPSRPPGGGRSRKSSGVWNWPCRPGAFFR